MPDALPDIKIERWTVQRKAQIIRAILDGSLELEVAFKRYMLSPEELGEWWRVLNWPSYDFSSAASRTHS